MSVFAGVVKWFDSVRQFGFIEIDAPDRPKIHRKEIFFHYNDRIWYQVTPSQRFPHKKDEVVFRMASGSKGRPKASPWAFADDPVAMDMEIFTDEEKARLAQYVAEQEAAVAEQERLANLSLEKFLEQSGRR